MKRIVLTALTLALLIPGMAKAQTTAGGTIALDITELLYVNIVTGDNQTLTPTLTDFDNAFVDASALSIESGGNSDYNMFIRGDAGTWTYAPDGSGNPDPGKVVGDLGFKLGAATAYTAMTTANQLVNLFTPGSSTIALDLRVALDYAADVEGDYSLGYTVEVIPVP